MSRSAFSNFVPYSRRLQRLALRGLKEATQQEWLSISLPALDGEPARTLRQQVPVSTRRDTGAFFTGSFLAARLLRGVRLPAHNPLSILDPACGAGDLLLAAARCLPLGRTLQDTIHTWGQILQGWDLQPAFVSAARARLLILARHRHGVPAHTRINLPGAFPLIRAGNALSQKAAYQRANIILVNPSYSPMPAPAHCAWASGKVNSAAVFIEHALRHARPATTLLAILPEVLRTGTRYKKWRRLIAQAAQIRNVQSGGLFDASTDVHVFLLTLKKLSRLSARPSADWSKLQPQDGQTLSDHFTVTVGPIVPYRDPKVGPRRRYIHPRNVRPWQDVRRISENRRFSGTIFKPPFVVIRRTSRPGDKFRAVGSLILGSSPVAVENHLIICIPKDGSTTSCRRLLKILERPATNRFLNRCICCRHLTVSSLRDIPWRNAP